MKIIYLFKCGGGSSEGGKVQDVLVDNTSVLVDKVAYIDLSGKVGFTETETELEDLGISLTDIIELKAGLASEIARAKAAESAAVKSVNGVFPVSGNVTITVPQITEQTVSDWGFTKNTGTYSKPSTGIPLNDLSSGIQTSLGKADSALQSHQDISGKQNISTLETDVKQFINAEYIASLIADGTNISY